MFLAAGCLNQSSAGGGGGEEDRFQGTVNREQLECFMLRVASANYHQEDKGGEPVPMYANKVKSFLHVIM
jgi:hypothetical protein